MVNTAELRQIFPLRGNTLRHVVEGDGRYPRAMTPSDLVGQAPGHHPHLISAYVKDTEHFLHLINNLGILPKNTILVTYDVTSLYTNIPLPEAERAIARVLLCNRPSATAPTNSSLLKMLRLIFSHNIFTFSDGKCLHYYLQTSGVSMGSRCAPAVACTYMAEFERLYIHDRTDLPYKPLLWLRFIDDIFCLWPHGETCLHEFTNYLNSRHPRIKFTCSFSTDSVEFLDTKVYLEDNTLKTSLFIKPTSSLAYLQRTSCHPIHVFLSLPYGEFLRTRRNSTDNSSYDHSAKIILDAFVDRGYDAATLTLAGRLSLCYATLHWHDILLIEPLGTYFSEIYVWICIFSFKEMHLKMSWNSGPICFGLNVLNVYKDYYEAFALIPSFQSTKCRAWASVQHIYTLRILTSKLYFFSFFFFSRNITNGNSSFIGPRICNVIWWFTQKFYLMITLFFSGIRSENVNYSRNVHNITQRPATIWNIHIRAQ